MSDKPKHDCPALFGNPCRCPGDVALPERPVHLPWLHGKEKEPRSSRREKKR